MNLLIPCSGPGTRSTRYSKFHKALIRIGDKAVLSHIIDSYPTAETIYITLGSEAEYVKQYIEHCNYTNVEFIDIPNWNDSQFASFKQIPEYVFDKPFFYNACDNWTTMDKVVSDITKHHIKNYMIVGMKDPQMFFMQVLVMLKIVNCFMIFYKAQLKHAMT
jgi:NDP-sugar pyrophosphorylase family protein